MSLKFSPKVHRYWLDGRPTPGVTTILGKGIPKPAIPYWAARTVAEHVADNLHQLDSWSGMGRDALVAALKQTPWTRRDEAAIRGTDIHALAERVIHGEEVEVPEHLAAHVEGYVAWLDEYDVEPIWTERSVASRTHRYAGRPDFVGHVRALGDETWPLDWKPSKGIYGDTALPPAAHARAAFRAPHPDPDTEHPMPAVDRIGVVHVTEHGSYLHDLGSIDTAYTEFLAAKVIADSTKRRDDLIGDPITLEPTNV